MPALIDIKTGLLEETDGAQAEKKDRGDKEVELKSNVAEAAESGLDAVKARGEILRKRLEEKAKSLPDTYLCKRCGHKFSEKSGAERHSAESDGHAGSFDEVFEVVKDVQIEASDRILDIEASSLVHAQSLIQKSNIASTSCADVAMADLMKCPFSMFERKIKTLDLKQLEKFTSMRFDASTSMRRMMATKELAFRRL